MSEQEKPGTGVGVLVVAFPEEFAGDRALKALKQAKKKHKIYFEDAAVIRQDPEGGVHYHETGDVSMAKGAGAGALIGGLIGILGGPVGIVIGAGAGALTGGALAHDDAGFDDQGLKQLGVALKPGTSAVALVTSFAFLHEARQRADMAAMRAVLGRIGRELSAGLAEGKSVALGMVLVEDDLLVKEVAADETTAAVISILVAENSVLTGRGVVTPAGDADVAGADTERAGTATSDDLAG